METESRPLPRWSRIGLAVWAVASVAVLIFDTKPWELDIAGEVARGEQVPLREFIVEGFWFAGAFCLLGSLLLLATTRWWLAPAPGRSPPAPRPALPRWFALSLLGILIAAAWFRVPALTNSLWNDEEYSKRRYISGEWKKTDNDGIKYRPVQWRETFWLNRGANNHVAFSIPSRLSLAAWSKLTGARHGDFSEIAIRLPAFVLGIGSIALAAWMMAVRGQALGGLFAAAILAFHPWHLRYCVEARGYASLFFFSLLAIHFLDRALRSARWKDWLPFAGAQFAILYSFPGALYLVAALNMAAGLFVARNMLVDPSPTRWRPPSRWLAANLLSAMLFLQMMGPCLHQIRLYLDRDIARGHMGRSWAIDVWTHLAAGIRWTADPPGEPLWQTARTLLSNPVFSGAVFGLVPVLVLAGFWRSARLGLGLFVIPPFVAGLLAFAHTKLTGNFLFSWYLVYLVPPLAIAVGAALAGSCKRCLITGSLCIGVWFASTTVPRGLIRNHDRQPLREAAIRLRGSAYPPDQRTDLLTVAIGTSAAQFRAYEPRIHFFDRDNHPADPPAFERLVARAREEKRPLKVVLAGRSKEERVNPQMTRLVTDPARFQLVDRIRGLEEIFSFEIYELRQE